MSSAEGWRPLERVGACEARRKGRVGVTVSVLSHKLRRSQSLCVCGGKTERTEEWREFRGGEDKEDICFLSAPA